MSEFLRKTAAALDALADSFVAAPPSPPDPLFARIEAQRGSPLPAETAEKIANDPVLRDLLAPLTALAETPAPLGGPSEKRAAGGDKRTDAERLEEANRRFVELVMTRPETDY